MSTDGTAFNYFLEVMDDHKGTAKESPLGASVQSSAYLCGLINISKTQAVGLISYKRKWAKMRWRQAKTYTLLLGTFHKVIVNEGLMRTWVKVRLRIAVVGPVNTAFVK